jgi:hypothetical protein
MDFTLSDDDEVEVVSGKFVDGCFAKASSILFASISLVEAPYIAA